MKKFGLLLLAVAIVALSMATSQAALVSLYTFDETSTTTAFNAVLGGLDATLMNNVGVDGRADGAVVGTGALKFNPVGNPDYATIANGLPSGNSLLQGSVSFWVKSTDTAHAGTILGAKGASGVSQDVFNIGFNSTTTDYTYAANSLRFQLRDGGTTESGQFVAAVVPTNTTLNDGSWHQVTMAWQATTGSSGTSSLSTYVDGVFNPVTITAGDKNTLGVKHAIAFDADWGVDPMYLGALGRATPDAASHLAATVDDLGVWGDKLTAEKAAALYNLGLDALDYNAKDANVLFNLFDAATGTATTSDGKTWNYVASGLGTTAGAVINSDSVNLGGASGAGVTATVTIPEPSTLALLSAAAMGLLVFVWRRRE